jgi:hypothetical protein
VPHARDQRCDLYTWKSKYVGLTVSDAVRLRTLEDENRQLKSMLAKSMRDVSALREKTAANCGPLRRGGDADGQ